MRAKARLNKLDKQVQRIVRARNPKSHIVTLVYGENGEKLYRTMEGELISQAELAERYADSDSPVLIWDCPTG